MLHYNTECVKLHYVSAVQPSQIYESYYKHRTELTFIILMHEGAQLTPPTIARGTGERCNIAHQGVGRSIRSGVLAVLVRKFEQHTT